MRGGREKVRLRTVYCAELEGSVKVGVLELGYLWNWLGCGRERIVIMNYECADEHERYVSHGEREEPEDFIEKSLWRRRHRRGGRLGCFRRVHDWGRIPIFWLAVQQLIKSNASAENRLVDTKRSYHLVVDFPVEII